jgi:hypothetical protein
VKSDGDAPPHGPIGGASGDGGVEYRRAVAAYAVAHGLAGVDLSGFGLPEAAAQVSYVAVETDDPVDDVRVRFASGWRATVQAKRTLRKGAAFNAAVKQWKAAAERGLDPSTERLVLVAGSVSGPVKELAAVLRRLKTDEPGKLTDGERTALSALDEGLAGLDEEQRLTVFRSAVIHELDVEEPECPAAREARALLAVVVPPERASAAWMDLVAIAGRIGRLRGGFKIRGWLAALIGKGHRVVGAETPAGELARRIAAMDRYRAQVRRRGSVLDLHRLGSDLPALDLSDVDAVVDVIEPGGDDSRDRRRLIWTFLARHRVVLTGLPGGGKSTAVAAMAAVMLDAPGAPLPIVVSLAEVDQRDRRKSFRDRLLDVAVRELPGGDRELARQELDRGLESGAVAVILDALDETYDRRRDVVAEIDEFLADAGPRVPVLLATRDVAYAQAAKLGWSELRLARPKQAERAVRAVLLAAATASIPEAEREAWVDTRAKWVAHALSGDQTLGETPLLPVLLALLAAGQEAESLPRHRAAILYEVVRNVVNRRDRRRVDAVALGDLTAAHASTATLEGFTIEANLLARHDGPCPVDAVTAALTPLLADRWNLRGGPGEITAQAIVRFWDESGIFVISGSPPTVAPRLMLFAEVGDALHAVRDEAAEVREWVRARLAARRHEPVVLAAGLTPIAAHELIQQACESGDHELLQAAASSVRQGAEVTGDDGDKLLAALSADMSRGDSEGWKSFVTLLDLGVPLPAQESVSAALDAFPPSHQAVGRAVAVLRWHVGQESQFADTLLGALRVGQLPRLSSRRATTKKDRPWVGADHLFHEAFVGAARVLLGVVAEADELVLAEFKKGSIGMREDLEPLLMARGHMATVEQVNRETVTKLWSSMSRLADYDPEGNERILEHLASRAQPASLDPVQACRLDELGGLMATLDLNDISAWPRRDDYEGYLRFVDLIVQLGGFDSSVLAAEAEIALDRRTIFDERQAFYAPMFAGSERSLDRWDHVPDRESAVAILRAALFGGPAMARVAAIALSDSDAIADLAVPTLREVLPRLRSSRRHQRLVAIVLEELTGGAELPEWLTDPNPTLRAVMAEVCIVVVDGRLNPSLKALLHDRDARVVAAAVERLGGVEDDEGELARIAAGPDPAWICDQCNVHVGPAARFCPTCHIGGPSPSETATKLLQRREGSTTVGANNPGTRPSW